MANKPLYRIIHEDDYILVVDKSPGIPVIMGRDPEKQDDSLFNLLQQQVKEDLLLTHRIDKDTSGLVLFAKTIEAQRIISSDFAEGRIDKTYQAIVDGLLNNTEWQLIEAAILKKSNSFKVVIDRMGKNARTEFRSLENFRQASLVEVRLLTGRTHQIRVHFAHIGHPLLVDPIYGNREAFYLSEFMKKKYKLGRGKTEHPLLKRQSLHASKIGFQHPFTQEKLIFETEMPKDMKAVINQLRRIHENR